MLLSIGTLLAHGPVKNIIFLIGDGMGLSSVSMMQLVNSYEPTIFDKAENIALQKTYSADNRVTDSAASGAGLASGVKTNNTLRHSMHISTAVISSPRYRSSCLQAR